MVKSKKTKESKEFDKRIGAKITKIRSEQNISIKDFAQLLDLSHQQVAKYERGINQITVFRLIAISKILNTDILKFLK